MSPLTPSNLSRLFHGLEALYGSSSGIDPVDHLVPFTRERDSTREMVVFRHSEDGALEVGLALCEDTLRQFQAAPPEEALGDERLAETLPIVEGLSHLLYLVESARCERPFSGLELEVQAEVDKLAVCLLHRWPPRPEQFDALVDRLYYRFSLAPHLGPTLRARYDKANRVALSFSRHLRRHVATQQLPDLRRALRAFWHGSMRQKLRLAT